MNSGIGVEAGIESLYVDDAIVVLDKPAGLLAVPGRGDGKRDALSARVQQRYPDALVVHRLDMATSGLMIMARGADVQRSLSRAFAERRIVKRYEAIVDGTIGRGTAGTDGWRLIELPIAVDWARRPLRIVDPVHGKPSTTRWRVLRPDPARDATRLALEPVTGRSHQLRVHMQALGHAILGDPLYATAAVQAKAGRLLLHACRLCFAHPLSGAELTFASPAPF